MLYKYFTGVILLLLISCNSAKHSGRSQDTMPGTWQAESIIIDGNSKDWPSPYPNYDAKAMVAYATSNDKQNLYITMETGDELTQMKILKQGMTITIDTNGKKDPQFNIVYPLQNDNDPFDFTKDDYNPRKDKGHSSPHMDKKILKSAEQATQFSIEGFKDCNGGYAITQTTACGIKVKLRIDEYKQLVWEAMIPFKAIYNRDVITAADAGKPISICFIVKGFKSPGVKNADNNNAGTNSNTGGVGMNSRMNNASSAGRGAGRGSTDNPMQHLYESTKTWKYFGLAYQP